MTDITRLTQEMKAAAEKAKHAGEAPVMPFDTRISMLNEYQLTVCPDNVLALVEALEKAQRMESYWKTQCRGITDHCEELQARIAELGSRTVTIEPFRSFVTDADLAALHRFAECCDDPESGGHDLEKEQVRRLEAIGALQRSGRISYITGFGDVLISITAGIKVEAK
ncbi:hypothetical protein ACPEGK_19405 [Klebsiella sp. K794]|uniref:Ead/Ea22-like family protein n=1 Tax=Klebsiella michiganensis TaxID=1134687 RepID=A0AAJ1NYC0_9ENTR|nr:hypothetical protein [Klebsiella michiganensis]MDH0967591.1 hypothetical protein [Klebsiella michiganensis]QAS67011.1 hypothetical protein KOCBH_04566 [Klebsiella michiganensis]HCD5322768.1 hypothetical protein [Klebsiella michiganensis]HCD7244746.1 hypothetical protein [Klebsiella michiganensis]HCD7468514.1 hypothetical protein [Klebsiella michiganensis]